MVFLFDIKVFYRYKNRAIIWTFRTEQRKFVDSKEVK